MFEIIVIGIAVVVLAYLIALLIRAFANRNHICPLCKKKNRYEFHNNKR